MSIFFESGTYIESGYVVNKEGISKMIEEDKVLVNGKIEKQSYKLRENDVVVNADVINSGILDVVATGNHTVSVMETRPLSKTKRWRLVEIVEKVK